MLFNKPRIPFKQIILIGLLPSFLKKLYYHLLGYKIGKNVKFGIGSVILGENVNIDANTKIGFFTVIRARIVKIERNVTIGALTFMDTERIEIGEDTRIRERVSVGGLATPDSLLKIGKRCIVMQYSFINPTKPVIINDDSGIGGYSLIFTHGSWLSQLEGYPVTFASVTIGKNVWLPWRVFIMPGITIGDNVVVGANSLISTNLPSNCLASGSPIKIIAKNYPRKISEERKNTIFRDIINDFMSYIKYNELSIEENDLNECQKVLLIHNKNKVHEINIMYEKREKISPKFSDNLLIIYYQDQLSNIKAHKHKMVLDIKNRNRIGKSEIGETVVRYLSRYGIRFNRLD